MKNNSALFFTCSLIEYIGREQKLKRADVVRSLGGIVIQRIYSHADVLHCEPIARVADEFTKMQNIPAGTFDNVADCRYDVPDYWAIGAVYERLIEDVCGDDEEHIIDRLLEIYSSWIDDAISDYNTSFYYSSRDYIYACYSEGEVLD